MANSTVLFDSSRKSVIPNLGNGIFPFYAPFERSVRPYTVEDARIAAGMFGEKSDLENARRRARKAELDAFNAEIDRMAEEAIWNDRYCSGHSGV